MLRNLIGILGAVVFLIIISCSLKEPVLPSWFVTLNIPLSEETFELGKEFVNGTTVFVQPDTNTIGTDSLIAISINSDLDTTKISREDLSIDLDDIWESVALGTLKLDSLQALETEFNTLRELFPGLDTSSTPVPIPHTIIPFGPDTLSSGDFRGIHLLEGNVRARIKNDLPVPFGPGTVISLYDSLDVLITQFSPKDTLFPGDEFETLEPIGNTPGWIYSPIQVDYSLEITETTIPAVTDSLLDSTGFSATITLENIRADSAIVKLPEQDYNETVSFGYTGENRLREVVVDSGSIQVSFTNHFPVGCKIFYTIPNITTQSGDPLSGSLTLQPAPSSPKDTVINLGSLRITNAENPGEFIDSITVDITGTTTASNDFVTIASSDSISVNVNTDTIYLEYFSGFFALDSLMIPEFSEGNLINYGKFEPGVLFQNAELTLNLTSELAIQNLTLDLNIEGYHINDNGVITHTASLNPPPQTLSTNGSPGNEDNVVVSISGSEVASFLNILPNALKSSGKVTIEGEAEVFQNSEVWGEYFLTTPLRLEVKDLDPIYGDVVTFIAEDDDSLYQGLKDTLGQDIIDKKEDLQGGSLELELINHTPLGVTIWMLVSGDLTRPDSAFYDSTNITDSLEFIQSASVTPADTDPNTGYVTTAKKSIVSLDLTRDQIQLLTQPPYKVGYVLEVLDTQPPGQSVALRPTDYVKSLGLAKLIVRIEDE